MGRMRTRWRRVLSTAFVAMVVSPRLHAQTSTLREVRGGGAKHLAEPQIVSLTGLAPGSQVGRKELQDAADALVRTGLFAKVNFKYDTHNDNLVVTFHIRSEEHTSELQSPDHLVCRLLLEKKKKQRHR